MARMKLSRVLFHLAAGLVTVHAAVNLDGSQAVNPVSKDDPSPIANPITYYPDQHDCPLPCSADISNVHKWTPYHTVDRLKRCELPMLLHFSVPLALDDPETDVLIRGCTLGPDPEAAGDRTVANATNLKMANPKTDEGLVEVSLDIAPACAIDGQETKGELGLLTSGVKVSGQTGLEIQGVLDGLNDFFVAKDNCDETFIAAYHKTTVAGVYIGPGLGKPTVASALLAISEQFKLASSGPSITNQTIAQICGSAKPETIMGVSIDTSADLVWVQKAAAAWTQGKCATVGDAASGSEKAKLSIRLFDIASAPFNGTSTGNLTAVETSGNRSTAGLPRRFAPLAHPHRVRKSPIRHSRWNPLSKRATCQYIQVVAGDGCASLAAKCGIRGSQFTTFNPKPDLCSTLQVGDYVCCSAGDPYTPPKPDPPQQNADGTCASHLIQNTDTCSQLATTHGLTVEQIESYNKGKTWGWVECKLMLAGYNMCLSPGRSPLPPPQQGTECGPLVPGTQQPTDPSVNMTDLNPCPLKACCSNWGFCGPYPAHCDIHAPPNGGPGTKLPEFQSTCVSNCGNEIKQNSGPPASGFNRIGYYESWNLGRKCLWLKAENANTDGSYTHMHWGFAEIDPTNWKVVIKDPHKQWDAFKKLNVKRIVSFGGWAYSTEPATYNIIRQAIIANRETFATNVAQFINDEKIDGVDIDWEYPGAPDILVGGVPIGQPGDGVAYLRFLTSLKAKLPSNSVSIAAPASYWYLKAFPIDRISAVIDYIVFMTYDLHGQWDYGNPNAFDSCPSGKCIRSHVNLTETRNTLSIITKAGVANNKIFVGESSYGRSFHMAVEGCWGPMCDFTGTRIVSDAQPGRCTETGGYISNAEINEIIRSGVGQQFHDGASNTDVLIYKGDYVSYMTPVTKDTRRNDWKALNFAGSIDWAVDLQAFGKEDGEAEIEIPNKGEEGCVSGESGDLNADELCQFACNYGYCPEPICYCTLRGPVEGLPAAVGTQEFVSWDEFDVDLMQLCKFSCKYGFCPEHTCGVPVIDEWDDGSVDDVPTGGLWDKGKNFAENSKQCMVYKNGNNRDASTFQCYDTCRSAVEAAMAEGRTTNYGCMGFFPLDQEIPWIQYPGTHSSDMVYATGRCFCDNMFINLLADTVIEALPIIAQIGCYIIMSSLKLVVDVGAQFIPGVGKILDSGLDAAATAAQLIAYTYPEGEDPVGAFEWWLSPCGGSDLVPEDIKKAFDILSTIAGGVTSFKEPKNIKKGSGKKGDTANPTDRSKPKGGTGSGPNGTGSSGVTKKRKCRVNPGASTRIMGVARNTLRLQSCVGPAGGASTTAKDDMVITSLAFGARPTAVERECSKKWGQACYHYSSAIAQNPQWDSLKCPHGNIRNPRDNRPGVAKWYGQHDKSWMDPANRRSPKCDADEFPPRYLLADNSPEMVNAGQPGGQLIRYLPDKQNRQAGGMWKGVCFAPHIEDLTPAQFRSKWTAGKNKNAVLKQGIISRTAEISVDVIPSFRISQWGHASSPPANAGMFDNTCWPSGIAAADPGFALFNWDNWYSTNPHKYDFTKPYQKGPNGS